MSVKAPTPAPAAPYVFQNYPKWITSKIAKDGDGNPRKVIVNNKEEEARHTGIKPDEIVIEQPPPPPSPVEYKPIQYPKAVKSRYKNGDTVIVKDHIEEEYHTGIPVDEDGAPIADKPEPHVGAALPPTLEAVMAAGYDKQAAENIVAEEQRKFAAGEKPYGNKEPVLQSGQEDADF